ncbi:hypothetical protein KIPB_012104, partial [Kipferlia bialata]
DFSDKLSSVSISATPADGGKTRPGHPVCLTATFLPRNVLNTPVKGFKLAQSIANARMYVLPPGGVKMQLSLKPVKRDVSVKCDVSVKRDVNTKGGRQAISPGGTRLPSGGVRTVGEASFVPDTPGTYRATVVWHGFRYPSPSTYFTFNV